MKKILFGIFELLLAWILIYISLNGETMSHMTDGSFIPFAIGFILIIIGVVFALKGVSEKDD